MCGDFIRCAAEYRKVLSSSCYPRVDLHLRPDLWGFCVSRKDRRSPRGPVFSDRELKQPMLEAVVKDGVPVVIYSHWSLSNGWEGLPNPYAKAYGEGDALKLGTNVLVYTLTH